MPICKFDSLPASVIKLVCMLTLIASLGVPQASTAASPNLLCDAIHSSCKDDGGYEKCESSQVVKDTQNLDGVKYLHTLMAVTYFCQVSVASEAAFHVPTFNLPQAEKQDIRCDPQKFVHEDSNHPINVEINFEMTCYVDSLTKPK